MLHRHVGLASAKALSTHSLSRVSTHVHSNGVQAVRGGYTSLLHILAALFVLYFNYFFLKHSTHFNVRFRELGGEQGKRKGKGGDIDVPVAEL